MHVYTVPKLRRAKRIKNIRFDPTSDRRRPDLVINYDDASFEVISWAELQRRIAEKTAGRGLRA